MKPLNRKNYGSIPHLSSSKLGPKDYFIGEGQERILTIKKRDKHDNIIVQEKYDGSNVGICKVDNKIYALTRSGYEAKTSKYVQHIRFNEWVQENEMFFKLILNNGERICGEWMLQAHGTKYKIKSDPIIFFDFYKPNNKRKTFEELEFLSEHTGIKIPRILSVGDPKKPEDLITDLNLKTDYCYPEYLPEGMVYRVERNGEVDFLAKWVRSDFKTGQYIIDIKEGEEVYNDIIN